VDRLKLPGIQCIKTLEDIRRLANRQPKVGQIQRNLLEPQDGTALQLVAVKRGGIEVEGRQWDPALNAALQFEELDVHVHRAGQLGLAGLDGAEFGDLARLGAR
jgi:hypothetical protein